MQINKRSDVKVKDAVDAAKQKVSILKLNFYRLKSLRTSWNLDQNILKMKQKNFNKKTKC